RARAYAETEYLNRWGEALGRGDATEAGKWLAIARGIGAALAELSGESLTRDAVRAIDSASSADRAAIAAAHVAYRAGRFAYSRHELDAAQRALSSAAAAFETARHPMALAARYYAASVRLARNETALARAELERARADADAHPGFINLGAHVRWELGRACMLDDDWPAAVAVLGEGAAMFRRAGERASEAFVESMLARALTRTGRGDEAWLAHIRGFSALSAEGERALLATALQEAMHVEAQAGRRDAAAALSALALAVAETSGEPALVADALSTQALLLSTTQPELALSAARRARALALATPDAARRARLTADADAASGAALATTDPRAAAESLTRAIDFYARHELHFALPAPLLLRARCTGRLGQRDAAMRDLDRGMSIIERRREAGDGAAISDVFDAEHALFTDAIEASLDRGDVAAAFAFAERSRGVAITVAELQHRLRGSGVAVIEIVALPAEVITFAISEKDLAVARRPRAVEALADLGEAVLDEAGSAAASKLYDDVIRPVEHVVAGARGIVIVPAAVLRATPFAALYDASARRYLIERFAVSTASSAASLTRISASEAAPSLVAIELGASAGAAALPEASREIGDVAATYRNARAIRSSDATIAAVHTAAGSADVLHIAGHTERQTGGGEQALVLKDGAVSWKTILAAPRVKTGVVVLSACETLRPPASSATRGRSLGAAFASAGAADVFGTLAPIGDRDARLLFGALHRRLAAGADAADALQAVLKDAITADRDGRHAWRSVALLTTRIPVHRSAEEEVSWAN
ncbi:MAG TPA: CHAT domain-containing protein, partial [Thermoanaerobaculia bacterium]|nr:CHAT domain-containing protein [Thermoanaerobaculia bacterium]